MPEQEKQQRRYALAKAAACVKYAASVLCTARCKARIGLATPRRTAQNTAILLSIIF